MKNLEIFFPRRTTPLRQMFTRFRESMSAITSVRYKTVRYKTVRYIEVFL